MKRTMVAAVAVALAALVGMSETAVARTYAIGQHTPDVILDGDPDMPSSANPGIAVPALVDEEASTGAGIRPEIDGAPRVPTVGWWIAVWRWLWSVL